MVLKTFPLGCCWLKAFFSRKVNGEPRVRRGLAGEAGAFILGPLLPAHEVGLLRNLMAMQIWRKLVGTNSIKLIDPIFIGHLLYARHSAKYLGYKALNNLDKVPALLGPLRGQIINNRID